MDLFGNREEVYEEFFPYEVGTQYEYNDIAKRYLPIDGRYTDEFRKEEKILFAYYSVESYSGDTFVLFEQDGKLYEVTGSHCSCYGLEGQWEPEETTIEALAHRITNSKSWYHYSDSYRPALKEFLEIKDEV